MHALYSSNHHNMTVRDPDKAGGRGSSCSHAAPIFPIPKFRRWTKELNKTLKKNLLWTAFVKWKIHPATKIFLNPLLHYPDTFFCRIWIHLKKLNEKFGNILWKLMRIWMWRHKHFGPIVSYWVLKREYFSQSACAI